MKSTPSAETSIVAADNVQTSVQYGGCGRRSRPWARRANGPRVLLRGIDLNSSIARVVDYSERGNSTNNVDFSIQGGPNALHFRDGHRRLRRPRIRRRVVTVERRRSCTTQSATCDIELSV